MNKFIIVIWSFFVSQGFSQEQKKQDSIFVSILPRIQKDKILLRWAVNDPLTWQKTNKSGFILEKYLLIKKGSENTLQKLWTKSIKADALETWEDIVQKDDNAAIIAQSIFGETFEVGGDKGALENLRNTLAEREQRFSFGLLAADMSFPAAVKAGWGYVDKDVKPNKKYIYKVKVGAYKTPIVCKSSAVVVKLEDYEELPAPIGFQAIFEDKSVMLAWNYEMFRSTYTAYNVERSEDGINFKSLSDIPIVNLNDKPDAPAKSMFYVDSLAQNNKKYYYRINGVNPFQEKGEYSKIVSGMGIPSLVFAPSISDFQFTNNENEAVLFWEYPKKAEEATKKFQLLRADKATGHFKIVVDSIPVRKRKLTYSKLKTSNYFKIKALGRAKTQERSSYAKLVQPFDSIPPKPPVELTGIIDTLGIARVTWKKNTEFDIRGYRVFRGFLKGEELTQLTISPIKENIYIDTVQVKNLNSKVYYKIVAVDMRYNNSKKSEMLVVEKPDVIPPTSPIFKHYKVTDKGVLVQWIKSSEDANHVLLRKVKNKKNDWKIIFETKEKEEFIDEDIENGVAYVYRIKAVDKAGLESKIVNDITIRPTRFVLKKAIRGFSGYANKELKQIELSWRENKNVLEYTIYKQELEKKPMVWRVLSAKHKKIVDKDISPNETYTYHIKAILKNRSHSKVEVVTIKY